ncbi:MAG TPA: MFS transporter [Steroidobacteraceae bacterium]|nr:MFS transporter [Steroidobacteraceae bacterium]
MTPPSEQVPSLWRHRPFLQYFASRSLSELAYQIATVAVGWQIYALTHSALNLGIAGLVQFAPSALLMFFAGHAADRYPRNRVVLVCSMLEGAAAAYLAWSTFSGHVTVGAIYAALAVFGVASAFDSPASAALLPAVTSEEQLQRGTALSTGSWQFAAITGPAAGGLLYAIAPCAPYLVMFALSLSSAVLIATLKMRTSVRLKESPTLATLFAGVVFVRHNPAILGTISLDLFAVLLGGATALLPVYASDILHTGVWGLGVLRAVPSLGALLMTAVLAHYTITRRAGLRMFQAVIVFGLATVVFGVCRQMWLAIVALAIMGAADTVSVVVRASLVQLATPDAMRGRVSAVNYLFINASNQLGAFESGVAAALLGAVPAVVLGGIGSVAVALLWMKLFPTLRRVDRLDGALLR